MGYGSAVIAAVIAVQTVAPPAFRPEWAAVLPDKSMPANMRWCSRPGPSLSGHWRPDDEIIVVLEAALAPALDAALQRQYKNAANRPAVSDYYRQYIGIQRDRKVYINGFHRRFLERASAERPIPWQTHAVNVCDGGPFFFGVDYDTTTRKLGEIHFTASRGQRGPRAN